MRFINNRASSCSMDVSHTWLLEFDDSLKMSHKNYPSSSSGAHVKVSSGAHIIPEIFLPAILLTISWNCCFLRITVLTIQPSLYEFHINPELKYPSLPRAPKNLARTMESRASSGSSSDFWSNLKVFRKSYLCWKIKYF